MNKHFKIPAFVIMILAIACFVSCKGPTTVKTIAQYVGDPDNGLVHRETSDGNTIICQLLPEIEEPDATDKMIRFRVYMDCGEPPPDSVFTLLSYRSAQLFDLIAGQDTLHPALSERVTNGRKDKHEFTLIFSQGKHAPQPEEMAFLMYKNPLFSKDIMFRYQYSDITKAYKTLYGYDQVKK